MKASRYQSVAWERSARHAESLGQLTSRGRRLGLRSFTRRNGFIHSVLYVPQRLLGSRIQVSKLCRSLLLARAIGMENTVYRVVLSTRQQAPRRAASCSFDCVQLRSLFDVATIEVSIADLVSVLAIDDCTETSCESASHNALWNLRQAETRRCETSNGRASPTR